MKEQDVYFGEVDKPLPDWRSAKIPHATKDDDEILRPTPPGVIAMLGFDPLEFEEDEEEDVEKGGPGSGSWSGPGDPRFEWHPRQAEESATETPRGQSELATLRKQQQLALQFVAEEGEIDPDRLLNPAFSMQWASEAMMKRYDIPTKALEANPPFTPFEVVELDNMVQEHMGNGNMEIKIAVDVSDTIPGNAVFNSLMASDDGRIMNQFELFAEKRLVSSQGYLGPIKNSKRDQWEEKLYDGHLQDDPIYEAAEIDVGASYSAYSIPLPVENARMRPKYGWIAGEKSVDQYGQIHLVFKPEVAQRTTFTVGNSSDFWYDEKIQRKDSQGSKYGSHAMTRHLLKYNSIDAVRNAMRQNNLNLLTIDPPSGYIEAQVFGSTTLKNDVREIRYKESTWSPYSSDPDAENVELDRAIDLGKKFGVPVRYTPLKGPEQVFKGGPGSGSWSGPGEPRFEWHPKPEAPSQTPQPKPKGLTPQQEEALAYVTQVGKFSVDNLKNPPYKEWTSELNRERWDIPTKIRSADPPLSDEELQRLDSMVQDSFGKGPLKVKMAIDISNDITGDRLYNSLMNSEDGRLLNQFELYSEKEIRSSGGYLNPNKGGSRDHWEEILYRGALQNDAEYKATATTALPNILNVPEGSTALPVNNARMRPKYGWITGEPSIRQYGEVQLVFKPEVAERTTFTLGNSSQQRFMMEDERKGTQGTKYGTHALTRLTLKNHTIPEIRRAMQSGNLDALDFSYRDRYIEAQILGSTTLKNDVAEIVVRRSAYDVEVQLDRARNLGKKFGIPVRYIPNEYEEI